MTSASELRQNIRFERRQTIDDGMGNEHGEWARFGDARKCKLLPTAMRTGMEQVIASRLTGTALWDCVLYADNFTRQITEDDRAIQIKSDGSDGIVFNIRFIGDMQGNDRWLMMQLQEGVASG